MAALTTDRMASTRSLGRSFAAKLAATAVGYQFGLASVNATGYAKPSGTTAGERVIGWFAAQADNSAGADGAISQQIQTGLIKLDNDATNPVTQADVGRIVFVKDDHTVQNGAGGSSVVAGRLEGIDADGGCWVYVDDVIGGFDAKAVDVMPDNSTVGGIEINHVFQIADAADADYDIVLKEKFQVLDVVVRKVGAGAGNTVTIKNAGNAITDAIAAITDKAITRAGTIDPAQDTIAAGGTLRASVHRAAGSGQMQVTVTGRKVA
jgi:hypothetical protein